MPEASIFTIGLCAIIKAVNNIFCSDTEWDRYTTISDALSAIMALKSAISLIPISQVVEITYAESIHIEFCWVPGHANVEGNVFEPRKQQRDQRKNTNESISLYRLNRLLLTRKVSVTKHNKEVKLRGIKQDATTGHSS